MVDATLEALASQFQTPAPFLSNYNQNETGDGASMDVFGPLLSDLTILQDYSCFCCFDELWCDTGYLGSSCSYSRLAAGL